MENKKTEAEVMDYLYGNLSTDDKIRFETEMKENLDLKAEVDAFKEMMGLMSMVDDKEVIPPAFVFGEETSKNERYWKSRFFKRAISIAASICLVMLAASLMEFKISYSDQQLSMGFGKPDDTANKQDIQAWMKEAMAEYDQSTDRKIKTMEKQLTARVSDAEERNMDSIREILTGYASNSESIMRSYVAQVNKENLEMIQNFFVVSSEKQQDYLDAVLADYSSFYQDQREYDLKMIETGLKQIHSNNKVKQYKTDQVLANLMDIVKTQNK